MCDIQKKGSTWKNFLVFSPRYSWNCTSTENFTHICTQTGQFFLKLWYFFYILKTDRGDLPHSLLLVARKVKRGWYNTNFFFMTMSKFSKTLLSTLKRTVLHDCHSCHIGVIENDRNRSKMWAYQNNSPWSRR